MKPRSTKQPSQLVTNKSKNGKPRVESSSEAAHPGIDLWFRHPKRWWYAVLLPGCSTHCGTGTLVQKLTLHDGFTMVNVRLWLGYASTTEWIMEGFCWTCGAQSPYCWSPLKVKPCASWCPLWCKHPSNHWFCKAILSISWCTQPLSIIIISSLLKSLVSELIIVHIGVSQNGGAPKMIGLLL